MAKVGQQVDQQRKVVERAEARVRALEDKLEQARKAHEVATARMEDLCQEWEYYVHEMEAAFRTPQKERRSASAPAGRRPAPSKRRRQTSEESEQESEDGASEMAEGMEDQEEAEGTD